MCADVDRGVFQGQVEGSASFELNLILALTMLRQTCAMMLPHGCAELHSEFAFVKLN